MNRADAWDLVCQHTPSDSLRRHMLAVECAMRHCATGLGEDVEKWGLVGLLHDFDYELHPDEHPLWGMALLDSMGEDQAVIRAIASHYSAKTGVESETLMERYLFACDELSGFITACVYVRPSRSVMDLEPKSVLKKLKDKSFAAAVSREDIMSGAELIGVPLEELIGTLIAGFRADPAPLGM